MLPHIVMMFSVCMRFSSAQAPYSAHGRWRNSPLERTALIMGTVHPPAQVKLFCALLIAPTIAVDDVETVLAQTYGAIVLRSIPVPFTQTTYYEREMGANLT